MIAGKDARHTPERKLDTSVKDTGYYFQKFYCVTATMLYGRVLLVHKELT